MENEYTIEEMVQNLKQINEETFWIERLSVRSFQEFKEMVKHHEQEMKRHENEETAWSGDLYEEEKRKRDDILQDANYMVFQLIEKSLLEKLKNL